MKRPATGACVTMVAATAFALVAACADAPSAPPSTTPASTVAPVAPVAPVAAPADSAASSPQRGAELADVDRSVDPCTDFYQFSNGAWRAHNPIPASMQKWSRRWQAGEEISSGRHAGVPIGQLVSLAVEPVALRP